MLPACLVIVLACLAAFAAGKSLKPAHDKDGNSLERFQDLSDLQLSADHENNHSHRSNDPNRNGETTDYLDAISDLKSDGPFSPIPDNEFYLDDPTVYFKSPKKTIKKDLAQDPHFRGSLHSHYSDEENSQDYLLRKCRELLEIEHLKSQWKLIPTNLLPTNKYPRTEDHELLLSVCRAHLGLVDHHDHEEKFFHSPSMGHNHGGASNAEFEGNRVVNQYGGQESNEDSWGKKFGLENLEKLVLNLGNLGIGVQGGNGLKGEVGTAGNLGVGGKGVIVGNLGTGGNGGLFGNVGIGSDDQHFDFFSDGTGGSFLHYQPSHQGVDQNGNNIQSEFGDTFSQNELVKSMSNFASAQLVGSLENFVTENSCEHCVSVDLIGKGGSAGNVVVLGRQGDDMDDVAGAGQGDYLGKFFERDSTENLVPSGQVSLPSIFNKAIETQKVARNKERLNRDRAIRCYLGALAHGGKRSEIGNLAINSGVLIPRTSGCCHTCHLLLVISPRVLKNGEDWSVKSSVELEDDGSNMNSFPKKDIKGIPLIKFRPIGPYRGTRRDWMTLYGNQDDRKKPIPS